MTVEKARKILGSYAVSLSDDDILENIDCLNAIIEVGFRQFERKHKVHVDTNRSIKNMIQ
ncbi:MAG: hypothetical protein Q8P26_01920 [Candidatus Levybacteria bacterium]|nr:hypothetical protein [Candidatus Levybacteria bacterium]